MENHITKRDRKRKKKISGGGSVSSRMIERIDSHRAIPRYQTDERRLLITGNYAPLIYQRKMGDESCFRIGNKRRLRRGGEGKKASWREKKRRGKENGGNGRKKGTGCIHRRTREEVYRKLERGKTRGCSRLLQLTRQVVPSSFNPFQPIKESSRRAMSPSGDWTTKSDWIICLQRPLRKPLYKVFLKRLLKPFGLPLSPLFFFIPLLNFKA